MTTYTLGFLVIGILILTSVSTLILLYNNMWVQLGSGHELL